MLFVFLFSLLGTALVSLGWQSVLSLTEDVGRKTRSVQFEDGAAAEYVVGSVAILLLRLSVTSLFSVLAAWADPYCHHKG